MPHYYGPGIWSNIYSFVALCVFPSCLQWDYKWKWEDNLCGQVGPNLIISFQSGFFFSVYNVFYASLGKHFEFDVDVAFCCECVCVCIWKYLNMRDSKEIILVLMILNFIECMSMGLESCSICNYRCCQILIIQYYDKSYVLLLHLFSVTNHWNVFEDINCCIQC